MIPDLNFIKSILRDEKKQPEDMSLLELYSEILRLTDKQDYIAECKLSDEVTSLAIKELQEQKKELMTLAHKRVDEL